MTTDIKPPKGFIRVTVHHGSIFVCIAAITDFGESLGPAGAYIQVASKDEGEIHVSESPADIARMIDEASE